MTKSGPCTVPARQRASNSVPDVSYLRKYSLLSFFLFRTIPARQRASNSIPDVSYLCKYSLLSFFFNFILFPFYYISFSFKVCFSLSLIQPETPFRYNSIFTFLSYFITFKFSFSFLLFLVFLLFLFSFIF